MVRALLTPVAIKTRFAVTGTNATPVASDAGGNYFISTGREVLVAQNSGVAPHNITITSVADPYGRVGHITNYAIPNGEWRIFQMFPQDGWAQTNGQIYIDADDVSIKLAVLRFP